MLKIRFTDILRATLPLRSGNEGWIGVSPRGDEYHIVVPVDRQIARGVMAGNRPADGTPFGGYSGWLYFPCPPYDDTELTPEEEPNARAEHARATANNLLEWLTKYQISASCSG